MYAHHYRPMTSIWSALLRIIPSFDSLLCVASLRVLLICSHVFKFSLSKALFTCLYPTNGKCVPLHYPTSYLPFKKQGTAEKQLQNRVWYSESCDQDELSCLKNLCYPPSICYPQYQLTRRLPHFLLLLHISYPRGDGCGSSSRIRLVWNSIRNSRLMWNSDKTSRLMWNWIWL